MNVNKHRHLRRPMLSKKKDLYRTITGVLGIPISSHRIWKVVPTSLIFFSLVQRYQSTSIFFYVINS